ncbi:MAG TPA: response regulator [Polyangiales bacterium]|jgi:CheY-like chemotaxis protein
MSESPPSRRARVLLVDDEPSIRAVYPEVLGLEYEVIVAANGREGLAILTERTDFDVIVCDMTMPGMDGPQFYEALRAQAPHLLSRVLFCSGGLVTARLRQFAKSIPNQFLDKPIDLESLCAALERVVHRHP